MKIGVIGAGTMGAGIAQIGCFGGDLVVLHDPVPEALEGGAEKLRGALAKGAERGRWSQREADAASERLSTAGDLNGLAECEIVVEAAPEKLELKHDLFAQLSEICGEDTVLASNTSSLSISAIATGATNPERVVGMHFFNPPPVMKLVEVVAAEGSAEWALEKTTALAERMGRKPIRAADGIGFVANRCARPFGLEALRILAEHWATHEEIDRAVRIGGGFRMGPFELMDLVGVDVNFAVACSFFDQSFGEPRWRPSPIQKRLVDGGAFGRKTGSGWYSYTDGPHRPDDPESRPQAPVLNEAVLDSAAGERAGEIFGRITAQIANEGAFALADRVGSPADIDQAMRLGFNWPLGPLEWADAVGPAEAVERLDILRHELGEAYRAAPLLREAAERGVALRDLAA